MAAPEIHAGSSVEQSTEDSMVLSRDQVQAFAYEHAMQLPIIVDYPMSSEDGTEWSRGQLAAAVAITLCDVLADVVGVYQHDDMLLGQFCVRLAKTMIGQSPNPVIPKQGFMNWAHKALSCFEGKVLGSPKKLPKPQIPKKRSEVAALVDALTPAVIPSKRQIASQPPDGGLLFQSTASRKSKPSVASTATTKSRTVTTLGFTETSALLASTSALSGQKLIKKKKPSKIFSSDSEIEAEDPVRLPQPSPIVAGNSITPSNKMPSPAVSAAYTPIVFDGQASTPPVVPPFHASTGMTSFEVAPSSCQTTSGAFGFPIQPATGSSAPVLHSASDHAGTPLSEYLRMDKLTTAVFKDHASLKVWLDKFLVVKKGPDPFLPYFDLDGVYCMYGKLFQVRLFHSMDEACTIWNSSDTEQRIRILRELHTRMMSINKHGTLTVTVDERLRAISLGRILEETDLIQWYTKFLLLAVEVPNLRQLDEVTMTRYRDIVLANINVVQERVNQLLLEYARTLERKIPDNLVLYVETVMKYGCEIVRGIQYYVDLKVLNYQVMDTEGYTVFQGGLTEAVSSASTQALLEIRNKARSITTGTTTSSTPTVIAAVSAVSPKPQTDVGAKRSRDLKRPLPFKHDTLPSQARVKRRGEVPPCRLCGRNSHPEERCFQVFHPNRNQELTPWKESKMGLAFAALGHSVLPGNIRLDQKGGLIDHKGSTVAPSKLPATLSQLDGPNGQHLIPCNILLPDLTLFSGYFLADTGASSHNYLSRSLGRLLESYGVVEPS